MEATEDEEIYTEDFETDYDEDENNEPNLDQIQKDPGDLRPDLIQDSIGDDPNVLYLTTPEGGPLIVAAMDNSETDV